MKKHFKNHSACEHDPGHEYSFSVPTVCVLFVFHIIFCRDNGETPSLTLLSISFLNICCNHYFSKIWSNKWANIMDHQLNHGQVFWTQLLNSYMLASEQSSEVLGATLLSLFLTRYSVLQHWQYCECCCKLTHALAHENTQSHFMSTHNPSPQGFMYWVLCCTVTRQSDLTP